MFSCMMIMCLNSRAFVVFSVENSLRVVRRGEGGGGVAATRRLSEE